MGSGYREFRPPPEVADVVACVWDDEWDGTVLRTVVPDGCVDLIWVGGELVVDGADTGPRQTELSGITSGIRVRAGTAGSFLGDASMRRLTGQTPVRFLKDGSPVRT